jgi:GNAT superfamily N-acetyltransferase
MRRAIKEDASALTKMTCDTFGDSYMSFKEMEDIITDPLSRSYVEEDEGGIAGVVLFIRESKADFMENMEVDGDDYDRISSGKYVLHLKTCMIRENLRGRGLMTSMFHEAIDMVRKDGIYGAIFTQGWIRPDETVPMHGIFEGEGYIKYKRQHQPWYKYADRSCVLCGGRCKCDAMVYYLPLE